MIEKITILGRIFEVECGEEDVARVKRLALSLERRIRYFLGDSVDDVAGFTHALVVVGLRMEAELVVHEGREESEGIRVRQLDEAQERMEDMERERKILRELYEEVVAGKVHTMRRLEKLDEGLLRLLRSMEEDGREEEEEGVTRTDG